MMTKTMTAARGLACIALSLSAAPPAIAACASDHTLTASHTVGVQDALVRLDDLRHKLFNSPPTPGEYGMVTLYASQLRKTTEPRLVQLFSRAANDQFARLVWMDARFRRGWAKGLNQDDAATLESALAIKMCHIDAENHAWLKADVEQYGWYRISTAGDIADGAASVTVIHSDEDVSFQQKILTMLEPLVSRGETAKNAFALLFDRVATSSGHPQRYGTQGVCLTSGVWVPRPIEDESQLERRRAEMELPPMSDYVAEVRNHCP